MMQPLLSIVIANYNYGRFLEEAIQSVLRQVDETMCLPSGERIELIIVDGGSTDNSVEIIQSFSDHLGGVRFWERESATVNNANSANGGQSAVGSGGNYNSRTLDLSNFRPRFLWCSERDRGQSHAFNKGFERANGRFLTWLNADDVMFPGSLARMSRKIADNPTTEWFAGGCFWLDQDMKVVKCSRARPFSKHRARCGNLSVWGPSSFFSKDLWERSGRVDVELHYMMDTDLWNRFYFKQGAMYRMIEGYCWGLRLHPDAKMSGHNFASSPLSCPEHPAWRQRQRESAQIRERYKFRRPSLLGRCTPLTILYYFLSRYDTCRLSGKLYSECFGSGAEQVSSGKECD